MIFMTSETSPPTILEPGSCQAVRIAMTVEKPVAPMTMTIEESQRKQLAYELQRKVWLKEIGLVDTK
jgi:hypothetical protein